MTLADAPPGARTGGGEEGKPSAGPAARRPGRGPGRRGPVMDAAGTTFWILAATLMGFVVWFALGSQLHYDRAQHNAYATFRVTLALALAPTGPMQPLNPKQPLAPGTPVAVLTIPEIGLTAVVFEGTSGQVLENGPGHLRDTPMPGQAGVSVILGRRAGYGGPFGRLPSLQPGDVFTVTTGQGVSRYRVLDVRKPGDLNPPQPDTGQGRLILVTANGRPLMPTGVLRVDADLTSKVNAAPPMTLSSANLSPGELALGTDTVAWLPLVLWGQGLLITAVGLSWARARWGRWQAWIVAVPVYGFLGLSIADQVTRLLPNIM